MVELPKIRRGIRLWDVPAREWRNAFELLQALERSNGIGGLRIHKKPSGWIFEAPAVSTVAAGAGGAVAANVGRLVTPSGFIGLDTLELEPWDGEQFDADNTVHVAKPWDLQTTPWNGQTRGGVSDAYDNTGQQRVATAPGALEEEQFIVPVYLPGDWVYYADVGYTGVDDPRGGDPLTLLDLNTAGRAWCWLRAG